ncbi:MAG: Tm-1-like ATP-binding domain-containing protein [Pseudomonadota bacterium]
MPHHVLILSTLETKAEETAFLQECLHFHGAESEVIDLSFWAQGKVLDGPSKIEAMKDITSRAVNDLAARLKATDCLVGLGGGTGGEIIMRVMGAMPITFPKVLITTLPFDPRMAVADNSIILVPTLADICGLNATLRQVLENAAAMTEGICRSRRKEGACVEVTSIGITAMGATDAAIAPLVDGIHERREEATVFHANGFGGAAYARFVTRGAFHAVVDLTPHEVTRLLLAGAHAEMPTRFTAAAQAGLPQIVLPGGINFIGLGQLRLVPPLYLERPHYQHSGYFTHVKVTPDEMVTVTTHLMETLNAAPDRPRLIVPLGGFSHQDAPGGAIEDRALRHVFLDVARERAAAHVDVTAIDAAIGAPDTTAAILAALDDLCDTRKEARHG